MPNPRVPDDVKKRRGTYRADRSEKVELVAPTVADETLAEYKRLAWQAISAAACGRPLPVVPGTDILITPQFLGTVENAMAASGITLPDGRPWNMSYLVWINLPNDGNPPNNFHSATRPSRISSET
jgi:hypothetical protein